MQDGESVGKEQALEAKLPGFVEVNQELICFQVVKREPVPVYAEKCRGHSNGGALIAVNKGMIWDRLSSSAVACWMTSA